MRLKNFFIIIAVFFALSYLAGCKKNKRDTIQHELAYDTETSPCATFKNKPVEPVITVWIHGTRLLPDFTFRNFFYTPSAMTHIDNIDQKYHIRKIAERLIEHDPQRFFRDHFYIFGWSGKASFTARKEAACELYKQLNKLAKQYLLTYGHKPKLRIITHSHGGNVALYLPDFKDLNSELVVDELILLACPVQEATKKNIADPLFKRCYALYSKVDLLQVIDPQGLYKEQKNVPHQPLFSKRLFPANPKLTQARIKINGRYILHVEFLLQRFINNLPELLNKMDAYCQEIEHLKDDITEPHLVLNLRRKKRLQKKRA